MHVEINPIINIESNELNRINANPILSRKFPNGDTGNKYIPIEVVIKS